MLKFIGNYKELIKDIYEEEKSRSSVRWGTNYKEQEIPVSVIEFEVDLINKMGWNLAKVIRASFYNKERNKKANSDYWHTDGNCEIVFSSYPHPTQILVDTDNNNIVCGEMRDLRLGKIEKRIKSNKYEIFTPEVGDFYHVPVGAFHRSNPLSRLIPQLFIRIALEK